MALFLAGCALCWGQDFVAEQMDKGHGMSPVKLQERNVFGYLLTFVLGLLWLLAAFCITYFAAAFLPSFFPLLGIVLAVALPTVAAYYTLRSVWRKVATKFGMFVFCGATVT